jgi:hypothetical protein
MRELLSMKETTIAFVTFFTLIGLVILSRLIRRLYYMKKSYYLRPSFLVLRKIKRSTAADFDCDCGGADCGGTACEASDCDCGGADCSGCDCSGTDCSGCGDLGYCLCLGTSYSRADGCYERDRRAERQARRDYNRGLSLEEKRLEQERQMHLKIEQENMLRKAKFDELKSSGYVPPDENASRIIDLASANPKTSILWLSTVTRLPAEEVMIVAENHPDFYLENDYVIDRRKIPEPIDMVAPKIEPEETKKIVEEGICPYCSNPFEIGSRYCLNCGAPLEYTESKVESQIEPISQPVLETHPTEQETVTYPERKRANVFSIISLILISGLGLLFIDNYAARMVGIVAVFLGFSLSFRGLVGKRKKAFGIIVLVLSLLATAAAIILILFNFPI